MANTEADTQAPKQSPPLTSGIRAGVSLYPAQPLIASAPSSPPTKSRGGSNRHSLHIAAAVAALTATSAGTIYAINVSESGRQRSALPADLVAERVFIAEPNRTGIYHADGTVVNQINGITADGYPNQPVASGSGLVVYVHGGQAYQIPGAGLNSPHQVGAADQVFPASGGAVGLYVGGPLGPGYVEYLSFDGVVPEPRTGSTQLPVGVTPAARLSDGLLIQSAAQPPSSTVEIRVTGTDSTTVLGVANALIGTHGTTVAWTSCLTGPKTCSLLLVDTVTVSRQVVLPPPGYSDWAQGGGFSPDGSLLAAFVPTAANQQVLRLVVIRTSTRRATVIGPPLTVGEQIGSATWSADGRYLFFGGLTGNLHAERTGPTGPIGQPWTLPLPTSYAITGL